MPFVNGYDLHQPASFRKLVRPLAGAAQSGAGDMLAVGELGGAGLAVRVDASGAVIWSRAYSQAGAALSLFDGTPTSDGGFLLLGGAGQPAPRNGDDTLLRIDAAGAVVWSRRVPTEGYGSIRLVRSFEAPEEFLLLAWFARTPARYGADIARLIRFDAKGAALGGVELVGDTGGRLLDVVAVPKGYVLVGDGGDPRSLAQWMAMDSESELLGAHGLVVALDRKLGVQGAWRLEGSDDTVALSPRLVLAPGAESLVVAGCRRARDQSQSVFVASLARTDKAVAVQKAVALDVRGTAERPVAVDMVGGDIALLVQPDGSGAGGGVTRLDLDLTPSGDTGLASAIQSFVTDLRAAGPDSAVMAAFVPAVSRREPFLVSVDATFACCQTRPLDPRKIARLPLAEPSTPVRATPLKIEGPALNTAGAPADVSVRPLCGVSVDWDGERMVQSPHLDLQSAGSDGTDAARGVLLRWFLTGALEDHLPKGDSAATTLGFNKADDYVAIYRAEWPASPVSRRLDFAVDRPVHVDVANRALFFETGPAADPDLYAVRFDDAAGYFAASQAADPMQDPAGFMAAYGARPIEVELRNRLALACDLGFQAGAGGSLEVEVRSAADSRLLAPRQVFSRQVLGPADGPVRRLLAENLRSLRMLATGAHVQALEFICYEDVLAAVNQAHGWAPLGRFALTDDDATAFLRLEDTARFQVDGHWRKFNDGACVKVQNYKDRWSASPEGLREGVRTYIQLSDLDPSATATIPGAGAGDGAVEASYLDMLQVTSIDHHVARMLGLGLVDEAVTAAGRYIHLAAYVSLADLGDGQGARPVQHLYMTLPTALADARLPLTPELDAVDYGLIVPSGSGPPHELTDAQGYTPQGDARYIRLYPGCGPLYADDQGFWTPPDLYDLSQSSLPALYGIEYRKQGEAVWRDPEIGCDPAYLDTRVPGRPEALSSPFPVDRYERAFIHKETEAGVHEYAVYGINIFSRASQPSAPRATDATVFRRRNTLQAPSDLLVQFIERESPLLLTTASEQAELAGFAAGADRTLVRLCCNYGFSQDLAYPFADTIEILHRRELPRNIKGVVKAAAADTDPTLLRIETQAFTYPSTGETIAPVLPVALKANFVGGVLVAGANRLVIVDIQWPTSSGADPIFTVRQPTSTGVVVDAQGQNTLVTQNTDLGLHPGDLIMAIENMAAGASWGAGNPLATTISIGHSTWTYRTEAFTRPDGTTVSRDLRGVWETAEVVSNPPGSKRYEITFDTYPLPPHPQAGAADPVSWWRGGVRVSVDPANGRSAEDRRSLSVIQITVHPVNGRPMLVATDDSGEADLVIEGQGLLVNYYPGYKVYLHADSSNGFDWTALTPAAGEETRTTLLGLRSRDSATLDGSGQAYRSAVGPPQLLGAREIVDPLPPLQPMGLNYATPPDVYGKSSYTMTVGFQHPPFAVVFYRASASSILEALYDPGATLTAVLAAVFPPDSFFANRFDDLFAFMDDTRTAMSAIPLDAGDAYALPVPDHPALGLTGVLADDKPSIRAAMFRAFTPLTRQPLIHQFIRTDAAYTPTNRPQVVRDANGDLLAPNLMDLAPMAVRPGGGDSVRFTDFTLDGSMNPNTLYFYCARELTKDMQMGEPSPISKPVRLINLSAPAPPRLRRMTLAPYDVATSANPQVNFELIEPVQVDPIARVRLFRTSDPALALSVRTMPMVKDYDLAALPRTPDGSVMVVDDFAQDAFVPYGDPLFYRAAWVREVHYEDDAQNPMTAEVLSEPTRTFLANVVDVVNPTPPSPVVTTSPASAADQRMVQLAWPTTVHNGTYYACQLDPSGNWARIGEVRTNDATATFDLPAALPISDDDGGPLYYRFKVDVQGSSGLVNLYAAPVTVRLAPQ